MEKKNFLKKMSGWLRAFLVLALVFLAVGLGTLGSVCSTGDGYMLSARRNDNKEPRVVLQVSAPDTGIDARKNLYVYKVYLNVGTVYAEPGKVAAVHLGRSSLSSSTFSTEVVMNVANFYEKLEGEEKTKNPTQDALYNWIMPLNVTDPEKIAEQGWSLSGFRYYSLKASNCNVMINEIIFVANALDGEDGGLGEDVVLSVQVDPASVFITTEDEKTEDAMKRAAALYDSQCVPSVAQSSYFRYSEEEIHTLMTISEMRAGSSYDPSNIGNYNGDRVYGALGTDLVAFGTLLFGISPFGLRFMPFLAAFGALVFGFLFVKKLAKSEKAGFVFALLFALCGMAFSLGHLGTPLMIGVFFLMASLYFCTCFYMSGMKRAKLGSAVPLMLSGLFAAAAICTNGAYIIPVCGIVVLFVAGMIRQQKAKRYYLDKAIAEAEAEEASPAPAPAPETEEEAAPTGRQKVAKVLSEYRYKNNLAVTSFLSFLVFGALILSLLSLLPVYYPLMKLYDNPSAPAMSIFTLGWKSFAGGFIGVNETGSTQSIWKPLYVLYRGTGSVSAVTATGSLIAIVAIAAGAIGGICLLVALFRNVNGEGFAKELRKTVVLLCGFAISFLTAVFAKGALAFLFLSYLFLFALAGAAYAQLTEEESKGKKIVKIASVLLLVAAVAVFALFAVFTFSIPTGGFLPGLVG